jgi:tetratricopeptide (TPR) repeat protein
MLADRTMPRRTPLDLPLLLFLGTALMGVWVAYDRNAAQSKLWMLVGATLLFYALAWQPRSTLWPITTILALSGAMVAVAFLLTHDWQAFPPKFAIVQRLALAWSAIRPSIVIEGMHPNIGGGLMALLIPFQWARIRRASLTDDDIQLAIFAAALVLTLFGLFLSSSRGAMLALATAMTAWVLWREALKHRGFLIGHGRILLAAIALLSGAALLLLASGKVWRFVALIDRLPGPASAMGRARIDSYTLDLIADFPFTGGGLASFPGLYSRYILGIPQFFLPNGHNILLDVTLEQGSLGLLALLVVIAASFWFLLRYDPPQASQGAANTDLITGAALASFIALLLHGMVEDTVYGSAALPLLFIVPGLAVALDRANGEPGMSTSRWYRGSALFFGLSVLALAAFIALPRGRALWWANLGAVSMARAELADFPTGRWVEPRPDDALSNAENRFQKSLEHQARQRTAHYRLGMLAMQRGDFPSAVAHLETAYAQDPSHIGIRKALGYSYAWSGNVERGSRLLATVPFVSQELDAYVGWWRQHGRNDLAEIARQMRVHLQ